jgi:RNA polymerase sigma-54 factor
MAGSNVLLLVDIGVSMDARLRPSPQARPKPTPKTVLVSGLLELATADLERAVLEELSENPALELVDAGHCERCGAMFSGSLCPYCDRESARERAATSSPDWTTSSRAQRRIEEEWDPLSKVAAPRSIRDHLLWQLCPQLSASELEIASLLLENLDHHGLLDCEPETVASTLGVQLVEVFKVLAAIQRQDPVGIGARTVQESLLVQLESLDSGDGVVKLCRHLIEEHWEALGKGKLERIAKALHLDIEDIQHAKDFIRNNLHPYPAHAYSENSGSTGQPVEAQYLRPDVIISIRGSAGEEEFDIQFPERERFRLGVHSAYREILDVLHSGGVESNSKELEHVLECVGRGKLFISSWQERWRTLRKIIEGLVAYQREFLLKDESRLRPLTRAQLADTLGLHESTVSRAVASKYAQIPGGRLVALADFFDGSLKAKALIKELVSQESHPLTDGELAELLAKGGVSVARRTVAKYRQALGILPSELR